jgi:hypothetical protein
MAQKLEGTKYGERGNVSIIMGIGGIAPSETQEQSPWSGIRDEAPLKLTTFSNLGGKSECKN